MKTNKDLIIEPNAAIEGRKYSEEKPWSCKGFVTFTVMGNTNSVVWRLYFYLHGGKYRCTGRDFFNWLPAIP